MSDDREVLTVRILDKEYMISCLPEERESLVAAARELTERMKEMRGNAKMLGAERMAVMTALNAIHEREQIRSSQLGALDSAQEAVHRLENKLDAAIGRSVFQYEDEPERRALRGGESGWGPRG